MSQLSKQEIKQAIMQDAVSIKALLTGMPNRLKQLTPMADQLLVTKDIEKAIRVMEKIQMGLGSVVV